MRSLSANGPASRDGRLQNGDRILAVNDQNCQKASYREVTDILKASRGTIKLLVLHSPRRRDSKGSRGSNASKDQEIVPGNEIEIEIIKGSFLLQGYLNRICKISLVCYLYFKT